MLELIRPGDGVAPVVSSRVLVGFIDQRSAKGIASSITYLVRSGQLPEGARLPTVRGLADELNVSATTVAEAWRLLSQGNVIVATGRAGTVIRSDRFSQSARRFFALPADSHLSKDYSLIVPDAQLLPRALDVALAKGALNDIPDLNRYRSNSLIGPLQEYVESTWPFPAQAFLACNGGYDGVMLVASTLVHSGTRVLLEDPTAAVILDMVEYLGGEAIGVETDQDGMLPQSLAEALRCNPVLMILQPRLSTPAGHAMTVARAEALAEVIERHPNPPVVLEDDPAPALSTAEPASIGSSLPAQVVLVRSWSKSHGPDLRMGVIGGSEHIVSEANSHRAMGAVWTSRLLQSILACMLADESVQALVDRARRTYAARRNALSHALKKRDVVTVCKDGLGLWVPVKNERAALVTLASHGIGAAAGSHFTVSPAQANHLRVATTTLMTKDVEEVADVIALAGKARRGTLV